MYIKHISLRNIRGFSHLDLNLSRPDGTFAGWTVFAGLNGSGKTTLLQALSLAFYGDLLGRANSTQWERNDADACTVRLFLKPGNRDEDAPLVDQATTCEYGWSRWGRLQHDARPDALVSTRPESGWFLVGYGPFRRLSGEAVDQQENGKSYVAEDRVATLFHEGAALPESIRWLQRINYRSLESGPDAPKAKRLERNILYLLNDGLLPNGVTLTKVSSKGLHVDQCGQELILNQLSDGYRCVLALVLDIVRHLDHAFGGLDFEGDTNHGFVPHDGVVLIDEVDAHLHISWQKRIGFWLKTRFPNIQFLVTTHSPFICQAADPKGLIRLPSAGSGEAPAHLDEKTYYTVVNGSIDDATLTELFGLEYTHSEPAEALREEVAQLEGKMIRNRITSEEMKKYNHLKEKLPNNGSAGIERSIRKIQEAWH